MNRQELYIAALMMREGVGMSRQVGDPLNLIINSGFGCFWRRYDGYNSYRLFRVHYFSKFNINRAKYSNREDSNREWPPIFVSTTRDN